MNWNTSSIENSSPMGRLLFSKLVPSLFVLVGAGLSYFGVLRVVQAKASEDWPSTSGRVLESLVESRFSNRANAGLVYEAEVLYEYAIEGTTYKNNRVTASDWGTDDPGRAQRTVNRYPKDADVTVYYRPDDPEQSVLEPGTSVTTAIMPVMGGGFLIIGLMMGVVFHVAFKTVDRKRAAG